MTSLSTRLRTRKGAATLVAALALCGLAAVYLLQAAPSKARPVINDISGRPLACLAYDAPARGNVSAQETDVWNAMRHAAATASLNVQQVAVPTGYGNPQPLISALVARHCNLTITIGPSLAKAAVAVAAASHSTGQTFLLAYSPTTQQATGIRTVNGTTATVCAAITAQLLHLRP